jgi:hypothetical protein
MEPRRWSGCTKFVAALSLMSFSGAALLWGMDAGPGVSRLSLASRRVTQDQGAWVIDYVLRNTGREGMIVTPKELGLKLKGWVSNSRVPSHTVPRWSSLAVTAAGEATASSDIINSADETKRCREHLALSVWSGGPLQPESGSISGQNPSSVVAPQAPTWPGLGPIPPISLGPSDILHLRLRIDHQHDLYGEFDPLLGTRIVELTLGETVLEDVLPLDREQYLAQPKVTWAEPPEEHRDDRHFISPPYSLHLEAGVQGHQSYRYTASPVRYNTKLKLRFWYLIASGTEGECRVHVAQNKDTPLAWRQLHEATFEEPLKTIGYWTKYERVVQTEPEATRLIVEFKITGEHNIGEMWIDDINVEPLDRTGRGGP